MSSRYSGLPNLVSAKTQEVIVQRDAPTPSRIKQFFAPIFSFFPLNTGPRTFYLWPGNAQAKAPVNLARSYGGIRITPELSLTIGSVWACVWRYANTVMSIPICLYKMDANGEVGVEDVRHPLHRILNYVPNQDMSAAKFWQGFVASMMTWGFGCARKLRVKPGGPVVGLKPMRPEFTTVYLDSNERLRFRYWPNGLGNTENEDLSADEVFYVVDRSMDGYTGLSRIQYAANTLGLSIAGDQSANLMYKNGLRASGILTIAQWLKPEQRAAYKQIVNDFVGTGVGDGLDKQFGVMVAENATKFEPLSLKPVDLEMLASRKYSFEEICSWYDVPPVLVHHAVEGQTMWGSGVEQLILGWLKLGLGPFLTTIEKEIYRQLLSVEDQAVGYYARYDLDELLRGDSQARSSFASAMGQNGVYTRNELRVKEGLPRVEDENADSLTVQSNMLPLEKLGTMPAQQPQVRDALRAWLGIDDTKGDADAKAAPRK